MAAAKRIENLGDSAVKNLPRRRANDSRRHSSTRQIRLEFAKPFQLRRDSVKSMSIGAQSGLLYLAVAKAFLDDRAANGVFLVCT